MPEHKPNHTTSIWMFVLPILLTVSSVACSLSGGDTTANDDPFITRTPLPTFTPTADGIAFVEITPDTPTPPPVDTPTPEPTQPPVEAPPAVDEPAPEQPVDTPAPTGPASVTLITDMNVRGGPGTNYPVIGPGPAGESAAVVGRNNDSSWLQVEYPSDDGTGWVYADLVKISGNPDSAPVVQVAAPPPVVQAPAPQPEAPAAPPAPSFQFTPTGWSASENAAIVHFKGRIRDEGGNLVNGYSVLLDNGAFSVLSHPTGASRWYPEKGDGEWDVVMPNLWDAQGWWWLTVVRHDCDFNAAFDAQCKQYTKLSEDVKIQVVTPEESVVNADWVCHWDCNKGLYVQGYRP